MGKNSVFKFLGFIMVCNLVPCATGAKLVEVNRVVARVNDKIITWGEIALAMEKLNFSEEEKLLRAQEFVDGKIDRLLSQFAFRNKGMELPSSYVEQEYSNKLMSDFNGDRSLFRDVLKGNGQSPLEYKDQLKEDIVHMHMLAQRKRTGDEISPQRVEEYYQENLDKFRSAKRLRIREIAFSEGNDDSNQTAEQYARYIHGQIINGSDFNELASLHGNSPFANDSGDWGVFVSPKEIRNNKLRDVAFSLKESEVSEPFEVVLLERKPDGTIGSSTNSAWYIIKVDQVEASKLLPIDEARSEIERLIAKDLELNEERKWLSRQKRDAFVDITLPN